MQPPKLTLASTSPRRREILESLGVPFDIVRVETDERCFDGEAAEQMVLRLAAGKAEALPGTDFVLAADTIVAHGDRIFGKPKGADDAVETLLLLSGNTHQVLTGVALKTADGTDVTVSRTEVQFREIGRDEAYRYWQSGEPVDKAGSYGIQGIGGMFVKAIHGSYSGVMGLPVFETVEMLKSAGYDVLVDRK